MTTKAQEQRALEAELAYSAARSDIEITARYVKKGKRGGSHWYDLSQAEGEDVAWLARAVRYLELRGSLERAATRHVVRVLDEPKRSRRRA